MLEITCARTGKAPVKKTLPPGSTVVQALSAANLSYDNSTLFVSRGGTKSRATLGDTLQSGDLVIVSPNTEGGTD